MTPPPIVCTTRKHGSLQGYHLEAESWRMLIAVQKSWQGRHTMSQKYIHTYPQLLLRDPGNSSIDPKWRGLGSFPSKFLVALRVEYEGSDSQLHVLKHQMGTHGSPKIKTPKSKPPKSKLQNPKSKLQDPKSKLQDPNPQKSKLQDPKPQNQNSKIQNQNYKIKTYINFWFMTGPPQKNWQIFFGQIISTMSKISKWKSPKKTGNWFFSLRYMRLGKWMRKIRESFP